MEGPGTRSDRRWLGSGAFAGRVEESYEIQALLVSDWDSECESVPVLQLELELPMDTLSQL